MSEFFDSDQVQDTLEDIEELQKRVQDGMLSYGGGFIEFWQEDEKLEDLEELFEKQQLMYVRMKLSDDPEAKKIVEKMKMSLLDMGMPKGMTVEKLFDQMKITINNFRTALDSQR